jgi:hypothetical protein
VLNLLPPRIKAKRSAVNGCAHASFCRNASPKPEKAHMSGAGRNDGVLNQALLKPLVSHSESLKS